MGGKVWPTTVMKWWSSKQPEATDQLTSLRCKPHRCASSRRKKRRIQTNARSKKNRRFGRPKRGRYRKMLPVWFAPCWYCLFLIVVFFFVCLVVFVFALFVCLFAWLIASSLVCLLVGLFCLFVCLFVCLFCFAVLSCVLLFYVMLCCVYFSLLCLFCLFCLMWWWFNCLFVPGHDAWRNQLLTLLTAYDYVKTSATILILKMIFYANHVDATPMDLESRRSKMFGSWWRWWGKCYEASKRHLSSKRVMIAERSIDWHCFLYWLSRKPEVPSGNGLRCCCSSSSSVTLLPLSFDILSPVITVSELSPFCACFVLSHCFQRFFGPKSSNPCLSVGGFNPFHLPSVQGENSKHVWSLTT